MCVCMCVCAPVCIAVHIFRITQTTSFDCTLKSSKYKEMVNIEINTKPYTNSEEIVKC